MPASWGRITRILGALLASIWLFIVAASIIEDPALPEGPELIVMTILIFIREVISC